MTQRQQRWALLSVSKGEEGEVKEVLGMRVFLLTHTVDTRIFFGF